MQICSDLRAKEDFPLAAVADAVDVQTGSGIFQPRPPSPHNFCFLFTTRNSIHTWRSELWTWSWLNTCLITPHHQNRLSPTQKVLYLTYLHFHPSSQNELLNSYKQSGQLSTLTETHRSDYQKSWRRVTSSDWYYQE